MNDREDAYANVTLLGANIYVFIFLSDAITKSSLAILHEEITSKVCVHLLFLVSQPEK